MTNISTGNSIGKSYIQEYQSRKVQAELVNDTADDYLREGHSWVEVYKQSENPEKDVLFYSRRESEVTRVALYNSEEKNETLSVSVTNPHDKPDVGSVDRVYRRDGDKLSVKERVFNRVSDSTTSSSFFVDMETGELLESKN